MRFQRGIHYEHPPRGRARKPYTKTTEALLARRDNLRKVRRLRSLRETAIIKLLIWQACFEESGPRPSQRTLARQLYVWPSYVCKIQKQFARGLEALANGQRVTLDDLADARRFTERLREEGVLAPVPGSERIPASRLTIRVLTADETIAEQWRFAEDWKRKHPSYGGRRVLFSVRVPH